MADEKSEPVPEGEDSDRFDQDFDPNRLKEHQLDSDGILASNRESIPASSLQEKIDSAELEKKTMEIVALKRSLRWQNGLMEWFKAFGAVAAVLVFLWTMWSGLEQLKLSRKTADDERLERAISRVFSSDSKLQMAGVSGVSAFLTKGHAEEQTTAMAALVDTLAGGADPLVRGQILDAFANLNSADVASPVLDSGLRSLLDRNRRLMAMLNTTSHMPRIVVATARFYTFDGYTIWPDKDRPDHRRISQQADAPAADLLDRLTAISAATITLLSKGGRANDFSGIYCTSCDFSGTHRDLSGARFTNALLSDAKFSNLKLNHCDFSDAYLASASFDRSDLTDSTFTGSAWSVDDVLNLTAETPRPPTFDGATLNDVHFAHGYLLVVEVFHGRPFVTSLFPIRDLGTTVQFKDADWAYAIDLELPLNLQISQITPHLPTSVHGWVDFTARDANSSPFGPAVTHLWLIPTSIPDEFAKTLGTFHSERLTDPILNWMKDKAAENAKAIPPGEKQF